MNTGQSSAVVLEARDVVMRFGGLTALDSVDVVVTEGAMTGLVGPNGAGKSTLFGVCNGLLRPNRGTVTLLGEDVTHESPQARARMGLARTFQQPEMFRGLTVRQHLTLAYRVHASRPRLWKDMFTGAGWRRPDQAEKERVSKLLDLLSLTAIADALVDNLPLGTSRLVEVGRALASGPKVVLLDGTSLLLVEHDVPMVLSLCTNIFVLDFGRLIAQGDPDTIRADPAVKAAYLGDTPIEGVSLEDGATPEAAGA